MLEAALVAGILAAGCDALSLGVIPTPGVVFSMQRLGSGLGVQISASHNPVQDNGIKFMDANGKLPDETEREIEEIMVKNNLRPAAGGKFGSYTPELADLGREYELSLARSAPDLTGMKTAVDGANGAFREIAPSVLKRLGAEVSAINCGGGERINDKCGSTHPEAVAKTVMQSMCDVGIAFDGDGDRVQLVDENGSLFCGDRILCALALHAKAMGEPIDCVVGTVMSNVGLELALRPHGIRLERAPVGDRYVAELLEKTGAPFGGEKSGHIILPKLFPTGDGMLTALQILKIMKETGRKLSELTPGYVEYPQLLMNVRCTSGKQRAWADFPEVVRAVREAESALGDTGRVVVRASGTEPLFRVMVEGPDPETVRRLTEDICEVARMHLS
jgi:phosphoglucosamine mutase